MLLLAARPAGDGEARDLKEGLADLEELLAGGGVGGDGLDGEDGGVEEGEVLGGGRGHGVAGEHDEARKGDDSK